MISFKVGLLHLAGRLGVDIVPALTAAVAERAPGGKGQSTELHDLWWHRIGRNGRKLCADTDEEDGKTRNRSRACIITTLHE